MHIKQTHISDTRPNLLKEHVFSTHSRQKKCSKLKGQMTEMNEHQAVTRGIKHWGLSGYSNILPRIKFGVTGQESSPQSPTISYRHPLATSMRDSSHIKI